MKKILIVTALVAVMFSMSCNKDTDNLKPNNGEWVDLTEIRILKFKDKIKTEKNLKSGDMMNIDTAVWYIEALLNYTYFRMPEDAPETNITNFDTLEMSVPIENGEVSLYDVANMYYQFESSILIGFEQFKEPNKLLSVADISFNENTFTCVFLTDYYEAASGSKEDGWRWGMKQGDCNGNYIDVKDASTEINKYLRANHFFVDINGGYWTDIEFTTDFGVDWYFVLNEWGWYSDEDNPVGINSKLYFEITDDSNWNRCLTFNDGMYQWFRDNAWDCVVAAKEQQDWWYAQDENLPPGVIVRLKSWAFTSSMFDVGTHGNPIIANSHIVRLCYGRPAPTPPHIDPPHAH